MQLFAKLKQSGELDLVILVRARCCLMNSPLHSNDADETQSSDSAALPKSGVKNERFYPPGTVLQGMIDGKGNSESSCKRRSVSVLNQESRRTSGLLQLRKQSSSKFGSINFTSPQVMRRSTVSFQADSFNQQKSR